MGLGKKTIDDQNYCGKKVLVRCDFNVPMKDGVITNENRINAALPTIQKLVNDGAKVILCSHLGKPKNGPEAKFSLAPVAVALSAKLGKTVVFADDDNVVGENAKAAVAAMNNGDVVLLQNTRFRKEETKNMPEFSEELASLADAYVDDAFGSCHRAHCSTAGVTDFIKDTAVGYLMEKEIKYLGNAVNDLNYRLGAFLRRPSAAVDFPRTLGVVPEILSHKSAHHFIASVHDGLLHGGNVRVAGDGNVLGFQIDHGVLHPGNGLADALHTSLAVGAHHTIDRNYGFHFCFLLYNGARSCVRSLIICNSRIFILLEKAQTQRIGHNKH